MKLSRTNRNILIAVLAVLLAAIVMLVLFLALRNDGDGEPAVYMYGDFEYIVLENGKLEIIDYLGDASIVDIPDAITGRSVYSIGESAFSGDLMEKVIVGAFTEVISDRAFYGCTKLYEVEMPPFLRVIGNYAFAGCAFSEIELADSLESIGDRAFYECRNLESVTIPSGISRISQGAFAKCPLLESVSVVGEVKSIEKDAFLECGKLLAISLPESLVSIGERAFYECSAIEELYIGPAVESIGSDALRGLSSLKAITVSEGNERYTGEGGALADRTGAAVILMPEKSTVSEYTAPSFVREISDYAFAKCLSLRRVVLQSGVEKIGDYSFFSAINLAEINLPDSIKEIGALALYNTEYYSSLTEEFTVVGDGILIKYTPKREAGTLVATENAALVSRDGILGVEVTLPSGIKTLSSAFAYCSDAVSVKLSSGVTAIGSAAFFHSQSLESVDFSDSAVSYIGDNAFGSTTLLKTVPLPTTLALVGEGVFRCSGIESIVIPASLKAIGVDMFAECKSLSDVTVSEGVETILDHAFMYCESLKEITIPKSVTELGNYAFSSSGIVNAHRSEEHTSELQSR